jgi:hypothetical protein
MSLPNHELSNVLGNTPEMKRSKANGSANNQSHKSDTASGKFGLGSASQPAANGLVLVTTQTT